MSKNGVLIMSKRFYCNPHFRNIIAMLDHDGYAIMINKNITVAEAQAAAEEEAVYLDEDEKECLRTYIDEGVR